VEGRCGGAGIVGASASGKVLEYGITKGAKWECEGSGVVVVVGIVLIGVSGAGEWLWRRDGKVTR